MIAEIPGEDPALRDQVVLVGAHLDSLPAATGATDNADGAAAAVEAMRILKAVGAHPAPNDPRRDLERRGGRVSSAARRTCSSI